ncbi:DUF6779 domain-containing protein, partial [Actinophytocola sp.]|uniref:DUF6779 domain-containing protein n=1 Tax=Actinophytocola sp. TaxID=1872138 RepID=UPI00389A5135
MKARRPSSDEPEAGSLGGRALLVGAVVFAGAATALLVLTDQEKWLRLGIVAGLWAALTGAFLAARYRRQLSDQREALAERQRIYELELEREIAARREHELTVEAEAKRKAEEAARDDLAALRGELANLRQTLEGLIAGEFMVERYALQAEASRIRSLGEDRSLSVRRDVKHLPAAQGQQVNMVVPPAGREGETEFIDRVREVHQTARREQPPVRPEPRVADPRPQAQPRQPERVTPDRVKPGAQAPRQPHPAEMSDRWFLPDGPADPQQQPPQPPPQQRRTEQPRRQEPQRPADPAPTRRSVPVSREAGEQQWGTSREQPTPVARHLDPASASHPEMPPIRRPDPGPASRPDSAPGRRPVPTSAN